MIGHEEWKRGITFTMDLQQGMTTAAVIGDFQITTIVTGESWCQNCYLVRHLFSGDLVLIDPGDDASRIIEQVHRQQGVLKNILITHAHHDHIRALRDVEKEFGAPCYLHKADAGLFHRAHTYALIFDGRPMDPLKVPCRHFNDDLMIGGRKIEVMGAPGHTPGSVCFDFGSFVLQEMSCCFSTWAAAIPPGAMQKNYRIP